MSMTQKLNRVAALGAVLTSLWCATAQAGFTLSEMLDSTSAGKTLLNGVVYAVSENLTLSAGAGVSALKVAENSTAVIYVPRGMGLVVNGGNASGATGAGAGIEVPSSSTLVITGGGTIIATGGNAADGGNGENGINASLDYYNTTAGTGGNGGAGGGGGAAGVGGRGGAGGSAGQRDCWESQVATTDSSSYDHDGPDGGNGGNGGNGGSAGTVYLLGSMTLDARAGSASTTGGSKGSNGSGKNDYWWYSFRVGGGGGGAGGGSGGAPQYTLGGGGAGGGGGGAGGNGGRLYTTQGGAAENHPNGAGGAYGKGNANGEGHDREARGWTEVVLGSTRRYGGYGGYGGAVGSVGGSGSFYRDFWPTTFDGFAADFSSVTTHSSIEYTITFSDSWRTNETRSAKLGYALPEALIPPARDNLMFLGWFTEQDGGTMYYNARGSAMKNEYDYAGNLTLYAHWMVQDASRVAVTVNDDGIVAGVDKSGRGWNYSALDGILTLTSDLTTYSILGEESNGNIRIVTEEWSSIGLHGLVLDTSSKEGRPPILVTTSSQENYIITQALIFKHLAKGCFGPFFSFLRVFLQKLQPYYQSAFYTQKHKSFGFDGQHSTLFRIFASRNII